MENAAFATIVHHSMFNGKNYISGGNFTEQNNYAPATGQGEPFVQ